MLEDDSVDEESFLSALAAVREERDIKIANIGLLVKNLQADIDVRKEVISRLQASNRSTDNHINWLKDYVLEHIDTNVKTPLISVRKQKGQLKAVVGEEAQLPSEFYKEPELKRQELKKALQDGQEFHDVSLERGSDFLVIQ